MSACAADAAPWRSAPFSKHNEIPCAMSAVCVPKTVPSKKPSMGYKTRFKQELIRVDRIVSPNCSRDGKTRIERILVDGVTADSFPLPTPCMTCFSISLRDDNILFTARAIGSGAIFAISLITYGEIPLASSR